MTAQTSQTQVSSSAISVLKPTITTGDHLFRPYNSFLEMVFHFLPADRKTALTSNQIASIVPRNPDVPEATHLARIHAAVHTLAKSHRARCTPVRGSRGHLYWRSPRAKASTFRKGHTQYTGGLVPTSAPAAPSTSEVQVQGTGPVAEQTKPAARLRRGPRAVPTSHPTTFVGQEVQTVVAPVALRILGQELTLERAYTVYSELHAFFDKKTSPVVQGEANG